MALFKMIYHIITKVNMTESTKYVLVLCSHYEFFVKIEQQKIHNPFVFRYKKTPR